MRRSVVFLAVLILIVVLVCAAVLAPYFSTTYAWPLYVYYNGIQYMESGSLGDTLSECPDGYIGIGETINVGTKPSGADLESNADGYIYFNESHPYVLYFISESDYKNPTEQRWIPLVVRNG